MTIRPFDTRIHIKRNKGVVVIAKVLLTATIESLGHIGEVVDVAEGYARNYLIPRRLAVEPTQHNIGRYKKPSEDYEAQIQEREEKAMRVRDKLADHTVVFERKAHDNDRLYGSVRAEDIVAQIETDLNEAIEPSRVQLEHAIETLGPHAVTINLYKDIVVELRVRVDNEVTVREAAEE